MIKKMSVIKIDKELHEKVVLFVNTYYTKEGFSITIKEFASQAIVSFMETLSK